MYSSGLKMITAATLVTILAGCSPTVTVKHKIEPIHVTVDVYVRVEKELDAFFDFEDKIKAETTIFPEARTN